MLIAGALIGGLWIAFAGALRAYRGVNETISTLLLNYIAIALLNHFVEGPLRDPASLNKPSTPPIGDDNMIGNMPGLDVHWGLAWGAGRVPAHLGAHEPHDLRLRGAHGGRQRARGAAQRAAGGAPDRHRDVPGRRVRRARRLDRGRGHPRHRQRVAGDRLRVHRRAGRVHRARQPAGGDPGGAPPRRHRRQRRPAAARLRSARRHRQRAAGDPVHLDPLLRDLLRPQPEALRLGAGRRRARQAAPWPSRRPPPSVEARRERRGGQHRRGRRRARGARRRDPHQHAVPVRQPGRVPDREERPREPGPRGHAGHGRDGRLRHLVPDRLAVARRAGGRRARRACWARCTPGCAAARASTTSPSASR